MDPHTLSLIFLFIGAVFFWFAGYLTRYLVRIVKEYLEDRKKVDLESAVIDASAMQFLTPNEARGALGVTRKFLDAVLPPMPVLNPDIQKVPLCGVVNPWTGMVCDIPKRSHDTERGPFGSYTNGRHLTRTPDGERHDWWE